jgi:hypothetical protein
MQCGSHGIEIRDPPQLLGPPTRTWTQNVYWMVQVDPMPSRLTSLVVNWLDVYVIRREGRVSIGTLLHRNT